VNLDLQRLAADGFVLVRSFADAKTALELRALYTDDARFRSRVVMERHAFGRGEYKYFAHPLPDTIAQLRERLYAALVPVANDWAQRLSLGIAFPHSHGEFLESCFTSDQRRPTPLLIK
jgi:hypothetical protein